MRRAGGALVGRADPPGACPDCIGTGPAREAASIEEVLAEPAPQPEAAPQKTAPRVMDPRVAYMIDNILRDAVKHGTGRRALELKRADIAGKIAADTEVDLHLSLIHISEPTRPY